MPLSPHKIRVGVLRGGPSAEYEVSLKSGGQVLANLPDNFIPIDIFISKDGIWHERGFEKTPDNILQRVDVVWNALHGKYGEDGEVQKILDHFNIPYTGSGALSSALAMNKLAAKKIYNGHSLKTPVAMSIAFEDLSRDAIRSAYRSMPGPYIVKPSASGSSIGVYVAHTLPELEDAVVAASTHSPSVIIEEYINGKEATCGVIDEFREREHYPLFPIEIRHNSNLFDYHSKYSSNWTEEICPGNFTMEESRRLQQMAIDAHRALGLRHYSRSDFIVHPKRGIYILETNTLPGLTEKSLLPKSLHAIGSNIKEFLSHVLHRALRRE